MTKCAAPAGCQMPAVWLAWHIGCDDKCLGHPLCDEHCTRYVDRELISQ